MTLTLLAFLLALVGSMSYFMARKRAVGLGAARKGSAGSGLVIRDGSDAVNKFGLGALPRYHGYAAACWALIPGLGLLAVWFLVSRILLNVFADRSIAGEVTGSWSWVATLVAGVDVVIGPFVVVAGAVLALRAVLATRPETAARETYERFMKAVMLVAASLAILITIGIIASLIGNALRFFSEVSFWSFITGTKWSVQTAIRDDQVGASGSFGAIPVFAGTALISFIAMVVAVPLGLFSAVYLSEYASPRVRVYAKPVLEILAGIPTVVYGVFAALTVAPIIRNTADWISETVPFITLEADAQSALAAGTVMGIMIIPFVSSFSDDAIQAVPQTLRDGSLGLGATKSETIRKIILPAALPGISGGILLAVSRAIGETMIVVMAAGLFAKLTANPLESVTTVTVQIVSLLVGDTEFDSAKTRSAFALGLSLFAMTFFLNIMAQRIVRKYREAYV